MKANGLWMRYGAGIAGVLLSAAFWSCVSTTRTRTSMTTDELGKIRKAAVVVEAPRTLSVRLARDKMTTTGAALFGLVGAAVEAGYKASQDTGHEESVRRALSDFDPAKEHATALQEKLRNVFPHVEKFPASSPKDLRAQGFDALLKDHIEEWGLRSCGGEDHVRVAFDVHLKFISLQSDSVLWERDELFLDGPCRPLSEFQTDPNLLRASLMSATATLAGKTANEIAFP